MTIQRSAILITGLVLLLIGGLILISGAPSQSPASNTIGAIFAFFGAATNYLQLFILDINRLKEPAPPQGRAPIQEPTRAQEPAPPQARAPIQEPVPTQEPAPIQEPTRAQEPAPPQAPVPTQEATPTSSVLIYIRLSGIVLIIGNIIFVAIGLLPLSLYTQPTFISSIDVILGTTLLLVSLGLPALQMKQSYQTRWVGLSSVAALCTSYLLFAIVYFLRNINYYQINYPLFYVAIALIVIGNVLLGIAIMRASTFPRWTGVLLIVSGIIWIGWFMTPSLSPTLFYIIINAAILPGSIALIGCGYTLLQQSKGNASTLSSSSS
jgi:hypothetical protein